MLRYSASSLLKTAYLDGEKKELLSPIHVYVCDCAEGELQVELIYHTPGLRTGLMISALTLVIWFGFELFDAQRHKKMQS